MGEDFELTIGTQKYLTTDYHELIAILSETMSQWNAYSSAQPLSLRIAKVPNDTPTLGISVDDCLNVIDKGPGQL